MSVLYCESLLVRAACAHGRSCVALVVLGRSVDSDSRRHVKKDSWVTVEKADVMA